MGGPASAVCRGPSRRLDQTGLVLATGAVVAITNALLRGPKISWHSAGSGSYVNPGDFVHGLRPALLALTILAALGALAGYAVRHPAMTSL